MNEWTTEIMWHSENVDCKQRKKNIGDLYVNIKSRVDS